MDAAANWESFRDAATVRANERQKQRMQLVRDIRSKMKEYSEPHWFHAEEKEAS
jgi:hypothetical protein